MEGTAAEFEDACWNGHPWEAASLEKGVAQNDPAALAEWATQARMKWRIPNDFDLILERSQMAAAAGDPLGEALYAWALTRSDGLEKAGAQARALIEKSNHPIGLVTMARLHRGGFGGFKKSDEKYLQTLQEAAEQGCLVAQEDLIICHREGKNGLEKDRRKSVILSVEVLQEKESLYAAQVVLTEFRKKEFDLNLDEKLLEKAVRRIARAVEAKSSWDMGVLGYYYCQNGRPNEGLPLLLESSQEQTRYNREKIFWAGKGGYSSRRYGSNSDIPSLYRIAREAIESGSELNMIRKYAANSYLYKWGKEKIDPEKAAQVLGDSFKESPNLLGLAMGRTYYGLRKSKVYDKKRGEAHYLFTMGHEPRAVEDLADSYVLGVKKDRDEVKAWAACKTTVAKLDVPEYKEPWNKKELTTYLAQGERKFAPEKLEKAKALADANFPYAEKFQREAFETLKECGDFPPDAVFEEVNQARLDYREKHGQ